MKQIKVVSAVWCSQCQALKKQLDSKGVEYEVIDADEQMEFCQQNGVRSLPTTFVYEDGVIVKTVVGNKLKEILE